MAGIKITDLSGDLEINAKDMYEILGGFSSISFHGTDPEVLGRGAYELIRSAFDTKFISKAGEVHAVDFDYSSKSQRKLAKAILLS
jgi:hypothetical protein